MDRLRDFVLLKRLRLSVGFLTIIPVQSEDAYLPGDLGRAAGWFPLIGAVLGGIVAIINFSLFQVVPPVLTAALSTAVWIALTGGLHLDGLADCCDGLLNASTRERRLEIMKDPRLGTFGGIGLVLDILLKAACLYSLPAAKIWFVLPLAAGLGRWLLLWVGKQPLARPGGMGADFASGLNRAAFLQAGLEIILLAALAGYFAAWNTLVAVAAVHLVAWLTFRAARSRLGGVTGDVFGLVVELAELVTLMSFCLHL